MYYNKLANSSFEVSFCKGENMAKSQAEGLVLRKYSGFYYVQGGSQVYECRLRGKIREKVVTGDRVIFTVLEPGKGVIEEVLSRRTELYRPPIANVDLVLIILACDRPAPSPMLLDRLLILAGWYGIEPCIIMNKSDLVPAPKAQDIMEYYPRVGYRMLITSALNGRGVRELTQMVDSNIAVLAGPSGVGKSSLLNAILPGKSLLTQEVSLKIGRGKHTTRHVELFPLENGGWIADTPGFSVLDLPGVKREELAGYFIEFKEPARWCRFTDCLHNQEQDCGVKEAVDRGEIAAFRYQNYLSLLSEVIERERCYR